MPAPSSAAASSSLRSFQAALREAKRPVALAGAGLSAASGISTFRGAGGLWRQYDALSLATPQAFQQDPSKVWQFYHYRRTVCRNAKPNAAHLALARVLVGSTGADPAAPSLRSQLLPSAHSFHLITQNVDGLSDRAVAEVLDLSPDRSSFPRHAILEMHGNLFKTICTTCGHSEFNHQDPIAPALEGSEDLSQAYRHIPPSDLPRCSQPAATRSEGADPATPAAAVCNGLLRPGVVWFGEPIPNLDRMDEIVAECDLILVLGTSSTVYPAAGFARQVKAGRSRRGAQKDRGGRVAVFNIDPPPAGWSAEAVEQSDVDWYFQGPVEQTLALALGLAD